MQSSSKCYVLNIHAPCYGVVCPILLISIKLDVIHTPTAARNWQTLGSYSICSCSSISSTASHLFTATVICFTSIHISLSCCRGALLSLRHLQHHILSHHKLHFHLASQTPQGSSLLRLFKSNIWRFLVLSYSSLILSFSQSNFSFPNAQN